MTRQLPSAPSLVNLKKQAKSILRAHRGRDVTCCEVLKLHHRFDGKTDEDILSSTLGLREVQHALARDYGFKGWAEMKNQVVGIDAPEGAQDYGARAKQALSGKVFGKAVQLVVAGHDRYGRTLGNVYVAGA